MLLISSLKFFLLPSFSLIFPVLSSAPSHPHTHSFLRKTLCFFWSSAVSILAAGHKASETPLLTAGPWAAPRVSELIRDSLHLPRSQLPGQGMWLGLVSASPSRDPILKNSVLVLRSVWLLSIQHLPQTLWESPTVPCPLRTLYQFFSQQEVHGPPASGCLGNLVRMPVPCRPSPWMLVLAVFPRAYCVESTVMTST